MDCVIPEVLYLQGNGVFSCHDDAGIVIALAQLDDGFSLRTLLDGPYDHMRRELAAGRVPWPGVCERCGFFRPQEPYRSRPTHRITTFQVETTLRCTLACPGCTRLDEIRTRSGPASLTVDRFEQVLTTAAAEGSTSSASSTAGTASRSRIATSTVSSPRPGASCRTPASA